MSVKQWAVMVAVAAGLVACGGGGAEKPAFAAGGSNGDFSGSGDGTVTTNTAGTVVMTLSSSTISATQSSTVTALVKNAAGIPSPGVIVTFALSGNSAGIGQVAPLTAITDSLGQATTSLSPTSGTSSGAAYVTASADVGSVPLTSRATFTVSPVSVSLTGVARNPASISGYGSSVITVSVTGASTGNPVIVKLSSPCSDAGTATITPASVVVTGASATATYQDKVCGTTDRITAQLVGTAQQQQTDLVVAPPAATGIQFVSVDNSNICLVGTGCPSNANVLFKVVDATGVGKPGVQVDFTLDASISAFAVLGSSNGLTDSAGEVSVTVNSKQTPTPLRVTAVVNGTALQTVSNQLTISGGLPVAGLSSFTSGMAMAATKYGLNRNLNGDFADVTVRLTDRFGAPSIDGTAVSFVTDGGSVVPAYCLTTDGACTVKLIVTNPRPATGRVHVIAYVKGQEYFFDQNSNAIWDSGETYDDVPVGVCLDKNENGACGAGEFLVGVASNPDLGNGQWDGNGTAFARQQSLFFFSTTTLAPRLFKVAGGACTGNPVDPAYLTVAMGVATASQTIEFCVRDGNTAGDPMGGTPIPSGSTLSATTAADKISLSLSNSTVPAILGQPTRHVLTITNTNNPIAAVAGGTATIKIDMDGQVFDIADKVTINP